MRSIQSAKLLDIYGFAKCHRAGRERGGDKTIAVLMLKVMWKMLLRSMIVVLVIKNHVNVGCEVMDVSGEKSLFIKNNSGAKYEAVTGTISYSFHTLPESDEAGLLPFVSKAS